MKTTINNNERKFLIQSTELPQIEIVCNLKHIPFVLAEKFGVVKYKISHLWNGKFKRISKKELSEMFAANQIDINNTVVSININALEWFDKTYGNSYFAATVTLNYGYPNTEKTIILPYQYGYGDYYKDAALQELVELKIFNDVEKMEALWRYCERKSIQLNCVKHTDCKKSELKAII